MRSSSFFSSSLQFNDLVHAADHHAKSARSTDMRGRVLTPSTGDGSSRREVEALIAFKETMTSNPQSALKSWGANDTDACSWTGVRCSSSSNNVVDLDLNSLGLVGIMPGMIGDLNFLEYLDLSNNFLTGSFPESISNCSHLAYLNVSYNLVSGEMPSQIGELLHLQTLSAAFNNLIGEIPDMLGNCSSLIHLSLASNSLQGAIPTAFSKLSAVRTMLLSNNSLSGTIPSEVGNCSSLVHLVVKDNTLLSGELPKELSQLTKMQWLWASKCNFGGSFPAWVTNFTSLDLLDIGDNHFSGEIPNEIGQMSTMTFLNVFKNDFSGPMPLAVLNCTALTVLDLSSNQLTGAILQDIGVLSNVEMLYLNSNNFSGVIPASAANCSALVSFDFGLNPMSRQPIPPWITSNLNLQEIWLLDSNLYGELPADFGKLPYLQRLSLTANNLGGFVPGSLGNLTFLSLLDLSFNQFQGQIPSELPGNLSSISSFALSGNYFQGSIPTFKNLNQLQVFHFSANLLSGKIDPEFGLGCSQLDYLRFDTNNFTGPLPAGLANFSNLQFLAMGTNQFSGSLPPSWGNLSSIQFLSLHGNKLQGVLPVDIFSCIQLQSFDIDDNKLEGFIPSEIRQLVSLVEMSFSNNLLSGTIPSSVGNLSHVQYIQLQNNRLTGPIPGDSLLKMASSLSYVDFSHNSLSGSWPVEIKLLTNLQHFDVSSNNFSGPISAGLVTCTSLQFLDVSLNNFSGTLPTDLGLLQNLDFINVSFNNFDGPIPDFSRRHTITKDSFRGNPGLCGPTLLVNQSCWEITSTQHSGGGFRWKGIWIPVAASILLLVLVGIGVAFWLVIGAHSKKEANDYSLQSLALQGSIVLKEEEVMALIRGGQDNVIGKGAKSIVYKGMRPGGEMFALKVLRNEYGCDHSNNIKDELLREVHTLAQLRHVNIMKVFGLCIFPDVKALILEYMPRGSLNDLLYRDAEIHPLSHQDRFKILVGVADSLVYLHHSFHDPIIHRDLKPGNILLGMNLEPKLADFGISKLARHLSAGGDLEASASTLCGTFGYMAPEYSTQATVSTKGDVYSYGVVLLEILTRRKPTSEDNTSGLVEFILESFQDRPLELLDVTLIEEGKLNSIAKNQMMLLLRVGLLCTQETAKSRPSMIDVLEILKQIKDVGSVFIPLRTVDQLASEISVQEPTSVQDYGEVNANSSS